MCCRIDHADYSALLKRCSLNLENSHIFIDGYGLILHHWKISNQNTQSNVAPNKIYVQEVKKQIDLLLALNPRSITFFVESVVTNLGLENRIRSKQELLNTINFDGLVSPRILTLSEIMKYSPKVNTALCDMENEHTILHDIAKLKSSPGASDDDSYLIITRNLSFARYELPDNSQIFLLPTDTDLHECPLNLRAYAFHELQSVLCKDSAPEKLPDLIGGTILNPDSGTYLRLELQNSLRNQCPVILLPVVPIVDGISPYDVGSVYRRSAYGSFLHELNVSPETPIKLYHQEARKYKAHPLRPLDKGICKAHARYWSQARRGTDFCDELIGFVSPPIISSVGRYLNDLLDEKPMRSATPSLEAKQAICYLSVLFYSLCVLSECEHSFSCDPYMRLLTEINPFHLEPYVLA